MMGNPRRRASKRNAERARTACRIPDGCTEPIILTHGFTTDFLVDLIRAGLATAQTERAVAGGRSMQVTRMRITDARTTSARGASMALILKRASASRHPASGTMTTSTCSPMAPLSAAS
jgi:hypothetical protein